MLKKNGKQIVEKTNIDRNGEKQMSLLKVKSNVSVRTKTAICVEIDKLI